MTAPRSATRVCLTFWGNLKHDARTIRTAAALAEAGADVVVVCTDTTGDLPAVARHDGGFDVVRVKRPQPRRLTFVQGRAVIGRAGALWAAARGLFAHVRMAIAAFRTGADVYHAADIFPLPLTWLVARIRRRPVVYEAYEISTDREGFQGILGLVRAVEQFLARRVDAMFATTEMRAHHFADEYGISLPEVLQNRPPYREPVVSSLLRDRLGVSPDRPIVLYQGGMQPGRGLFNLLDAAVRVRGATFALLGGGMMAEALRQRIVDLELSDRVHLLPPVPAAELHAWTCSADIGVQILENTCLNHYTTDSNKLFEFAMAGLPVIASDFPEIRRVVSANEIGMLVDPSDLPAIVSAIQRLVDDRELRARYAANALQAGPMLSWETQVPILLGTYRRLGLSTFLEGKG